MEYFLRACGPSTDHYSYLIPLQNKDDVQEIERHIAYLASDTGWSDMVADEGEECGIEAEILEIASRQDIDIIGIIQKGNEREEAAQKRYNEQEEHKQYERLKQKYEKPTEP